MKNRRAEVATGNVQMLRMVRRVLMALACAAIGGAPLCFGQTPKFEGAYKGTIVLSSAEGGNTASSCNPSTNKFEQIMTVSGDRVYLERKAVQQNIILSGTVGADGTVSGSGVAPPDSAQPNAGVLQMLTGKIENNQFSGLIRSRYCAWSVKMNK
jgi:hypothetical protein